jgi:glycosyltransferase involved in cell wall biosynthesis
MSEPEFSFITATYNCGRFIRRCHWSLCQQTLPNWEWVVVDDGSTDDTAAVIATLNDHRIRYLRSGRTRGPGAARNYAMQQARASWLVIQDMDDFSLPTRLQLAWTARDQGYDFMCSYMALIDGEYAFKGLRGWQTARYPCSFPHASLCGQAELMRRIGYPEYRRGEDQTMVLHLANNHRGLHLPEPLYVYHENASVSAGKAMLGHFRMACQIGDLAHRGVLRPGVEVYRSLALSLVKMSLLSVACLLGPKFYQMTLKRREKLRVGGSELLNPGQREFLLHVATKFPLTGGAR